MKKNTKLLSKLALTVATIFFCVLNVQASCTMEQRADMNDAARLVRTSLEINEREQRVDSSWFAEPGEELDDIYMTIYQFKINIYNIVDGIYVTLTNSLTRAVTTIYPSMTEDGVFTYTTEDIDNIVNYEIRIFTNITGCVGDQITSSTLVKPMFNYLSTFGDCEGMEEVPYCRRFVEREVNITQEELPAALERFFAEGGANGNGNGNDDGFFAGIGNWISERSTTIIIGVIIIAAGVAGGVIYANRKRRKI